MVTLSDGGWTFATAWFRRKPAATRAKQSKKVHEFSRRVYRETNGATPELRALVARYVSEKKGRID